MDVVSGLKVILYTPSSVCHFTPKSEQIVCGKKNKVCFKNHNLKFGCLFFLMYLCTAIPPIWLSW